MAIAEALPNSNRIRVQTCEDGSLRLRPYLVDPGVRGVGKVGVFAVVDDIHKPLPSFPKKSGALPHMLFREHFDDGGFTGRVVTRKKQAWGLLTGEVAGLIRGTCFKDADQVFKGLLAREDRFRGADRVRNMSLERNA